MPDNNGEYLSKAPLTPEERSSIRRMIRDEARAKWLRVMIRVYAGYASAFIVGTYAIQEIFFKLWKKS